MSASFRETLQANLEAKAQEEKFQRDLPTLREQKRAELGALFDEIRNYLQPELKEGLIKVRLTELERMDEVFGQILLPNIDLVNGNKSVVFEALDFYCVVIHPKDKTTISYTLNRADEASRTEWYFNKIPGDTAIGDVVIVLDAEVEQARAKRILSRESLTNVLQDLLART